MAKRNIRFTRIEKIVVAVTCCLGVLLLVVVPIRWRQMEADPQINIPVVAPPLTNALDFYTEAGNLVTDIEEIRYAITVKTDTSHIKFPVTLGSGKVLKRLHSLKEKEALLKQNKEVLRLLRQGFQYPYQGPIARSFDTGMESFPAFRNISQVLILEGQVSAARGKWADAANSYLDSMQLGAVARSGGDYYGMLIGMSCESIGHRSLPGVIEHLNAQQARQATRRLGTLDPLRPNLTALLEAQKRHGQVILMDTFKKSNWREHLFASLYENAMMYQGNRDATRLRIDRLRIEFIGKSNVMQSYTKAMNELIATSKRPYRARLSTPVPQSTPEQQDLILSAVFPDTSHIFFQHARGDAFNALLLVSCALHTYKLEHRKYPAKLSELVPAYLKELPRDPFNAQGDFTYKGNGQKYTLYSFGPDCKDNGGAPATSPNNPGKYNQYVLAESQGDIVLGINR